MNQSRPAHRRLFLEGLERRELLAGNVLVELDGGNLIVTGDDAANQISIFQQPGGLFTITGQDGEEFTGPTEEIIARNITVNLGAGDDSVVIAAQPVEGEDLLPAQVIGTTTVNGGDGSDILAVSVVGRQVETFVLPAIAIRIDGGAPAAGSEASQDDTAVLVNSAAGLVSVRTGVGDDIIEINNLLAVSLNVDAGPASLANGATDSDLVTVSTATAATATINLGLNSSGNLLTIEDGLYGTLSANGGNGVDNVAIDGTLAGLSLTLNTYGGADSVLLNTVQTGLTQADYNDLLDLVVGAFGLDLSVLPFDIRGLISYLPSLPGYMTISTGDGDDIVTANNLFSTLSIYLYLDGGNDQLFANDVEATIAWFFGGAGTDGRLVTNVDALSELELQFETLLEIEDPNAPLT